MIVSVIGGLMVARLAWSFWNANGVWSGRARRHARAGTTIAIVTFVAALSTPRLASATIYTWIKGGGGSWTSASNWSCSTQGGDCTVKYPHAAGDAAFFTAPSTGTREISIPNNTSITVGMIFLGGAHEVRITGGIGAVLHLDNGAIPALILRTEPSTSSGFVDEIGATVVLHTRVEIVPQGEFLSITGSFTDDGGGRTLTKYGSGQIRLWAPVTYGGPTIIADGSLFVASTAGPRLLGSLVIGDDVGGGQSARLTMARFEGLDDAANIVVKSDGLLDIFAADRVGDITVQNGVVAVHNATLAMHSLTTTGVSELRSHDGAHFALEGDVSVTGTCRIIRSSGRVAARSTWVRPRAPSRSSIPTRAATR